jgi:hypothetical protein
MKERITDLNCSLKAIVIKLVGGNPGAVRVCCEIISKAEQIDPDSNLGLGALLSFDSYHIYDERIWMLFKDVCEGNVVKVIALLRAVQLGLLSISTLNHAIDNYGEGLNINECIAKVRKQLPNFTSEAI